MSRRNHFCSALVVAAGLFAMHASAGDTLEGTTPSTNHTAYNASLRSGETVGNRQVERAFLTVGTNQFMFILPNDFRMDATNPQRIALTDRTDTYIITIRVLPSAPVEGDAQSAYFRGLALTRFPAAKITEESSEFAGTHSGPAFNLQWAGSNGSPQVARIAFIPSATGVLEFCVMTRSSEFKDAQLYLTILLASVRSNEAGKIVITPLPDFS